jgi:phage terminase large subunit-like protein
MPWQQLVADVAMEIDPGTGKLAYAELGLTVPRQSGKSTWVLAKAVHRCSATGFFGRRQRVVYTAQTRQKAREKWEEDYAEELEASKTWGSKVIVHKGNGNEHIKFPSKSRFGIEANTEKAGHGGTIDEAYLDEAFAHTDARLEQAFRPAMITRANKLLAWISTAGWLDASPYLQDKVKQGRAAVEADLRTRLAYFEWSAPQDADPTDRAVWRACMPALGYTIDEDAIALELDSMKLTDFKRAYLNLWVPREVPRVDVLPGWDELADVESTIDHDPMFALDMTPDQSRASIGVAGIRADGRHHLEVIENRPGSDWVVEICDKLTRDGEAIVIDPLGPAGSLIQQLENAGVPLEKINTRDLVQACGALFNAVGAGEVRHLDDPRLNDAVKEARKRKLGDAWAFERDTAADSSPLLAVTLARHGLMSGLGGSVYESSDLKVLG